MFIKALKKLAFRLIILALIFSSNLAGQQLQKPAYSVKVFRYLALGDSYTIGTAIGKENSYASLLAKDLAKADDVDSVHLNIIAQNGWTTNDLLNGIRQHQPDSNYHLVSVLIGVNNQYQKRSLAEYKEELTQLLRQAILLAQNQKERVIVLSIPDWGSTPSGAGNRSTISSEINAFTTVQIHLCDSLNLKFVDITGISRTAFDKPQLVAKDQLHFSAEMHVLWLAKLKNALNPVIFKQP